MSREMWSQLDKYRDETSLNAETLNVPIEQLGSRTEYLYARMLRFLDGEAMSAVVLTNVDLSTDAGSEPSEGNAVYLDRETGRFAKAKATMSLYDDFKAAESAFTVGILQTRGDSAKGDVILYGVMNLNPDGNPVMAKEMIESGEEFRPGRYFLSAKESGKLTANPTGPLIYVCTIDGGVDAVGGMTGKAIVSPQFLDIGTSHVHRTAALTARPAGTFGTEGYLPIGFSGSDSSSSGDSSSSSPASMSPVALRFGGTWTADRKIDYSFWLSGEYADWPNNVTLCWKEDGGPQKSVKIPGPDIEVPISNGLTARLSLPDSDSMHAYSLPSAYDRTWETLTFPDAGRGWLDHEAMAIAMSESVPGLRVAVKGRFGSTRTVVRAVTFEQAQEYSIRAQDVSDGIVVRYGDVYCQFTKDVSSYSGSYEPVPTGTGVADSLLYLVECINKFEHSGTLAVFEGDGYAALIIMDGGQITFDGAEPSLMRSWLGGSFDVYGGTDLRMAVLDANGMVLSESPVVEGIESFAWKRSGDISVMVYQDDDEDDLYVPNGTVAEGVAIDYEPDAVYDYVLGMDQQVSKYWPPVPPKSAALVVNGVEMDNKAIVHDNPTVSFSRDTIHWFEDDEGRRPWPDAMKRRDEKIDPALDKTEVMHWVRGFQGATGPVTSIQPKPGSPLKVFAYGTFDGANTGDLEIDAELDIKIENGGAPGFYVPKRMRSGRMIAGPVVERIIGGAGLSVVSQAGCPNGQGTVTISLDNGAYGNQFTDIALENAEQAKIGMFPYIRLRGYSGSSIQSPSAFTATVRVPTNLPDAKYAMRISASVFGEAGFTGNSTRSACVKLSYNILPDFSATGSLKYSNLKTGLLRPDGERTVLIPFGHIDGTGITYNGFDPILVTTDDAGVSDSSDVVAKVLGGDIPFAPDFELQGIIPELKPGYLVGIRISRAVTQGYEVVEYPEAIGFINLMWSLASAE